MLSSLWFDLVMPLHSQLLIATGLSSLHHYAEGINWRRKQMHVVRFSGKLWASPPPFWPDFLLARPPCPCDRMGSVALVLTVQPRLHTGWSKLLSAGAWPLCPDRFSAGGANRPHPFASHVSKGLGAPSGEGWGAGHLRLWAVVELRVSRHQHRKWSARFPF